MVPKAAHPAVMAKSFWETQLNWPIVGNSCVTSYRSVQLFPKGANNQKSCSTCKAVGTLLSAVEGIRCHGPILAMKASISPPSFPCSGCWSGKSPASLVTIVDEIHTWVDVAVQHPGIGRNIGEPLARIVSKEIVGLTRKLIQTDDLRMRGSSHEIEAQHLLAGLVTESQHRTSAG